jgi:hypothetical protein
MPEWMLTDKERLAISIVLYQSAEYQEHCYLPPDDFYKAIAKAQARKIAEWGIGLCSDKSHTFSFNVFYNKLTRFECPLCIEQFKKEVGLDE